MTLLPHTQYALALGYNVALGSLDNVEAHFYGVNRVTVNEPPIRVVITSDSPDLAPIQLQSLDAAESQDGIVYHSWNLVLTTLGIKQWLNTYFAARVASVNGSTAIPMTIYTRLHELDTYNRYNCYAIFPSKTGGDLTYSHKRGRFVLRQRFNDLIASS